MATTCYGLAAVMGSFLLSAGARGKRPYCDPQPLDGAQGLVDIEIQAKEILYLKGYLNERLMAHTGQPLAKIEEDTDRDNFLSPGEARD